jgi:ABC-type transporter Mla subunit MlaD
MNNIKSIAVNIGKLNDSGLADVAAALKALTDAVAASDELIDETRSSALEQLETLSEQALLPENERMKPGILRAIGNALSSTLATAGGLAEVWSTWGPSVLAFLGL